MNKKDFFDSIRQSVFGGNLTQEQVKNVEMILGASDRMPLSWVAYILATATHETGRVMAPIKETVQAWHKNKNPSDKEVMRRLQRAYDARKLKWVRSPYWNQGWFGRGYVQITHKRNYEKLGKAIGVDLVGNPDMALQPRVAAQILVKGMVDGLFTGKKLVDYLPGDYRNARRIVNGMDRADEIASLAMKYEDALLIAGYKAIPEPVGKGQPSGSSKPAPANGRGGLVALIIGAIAVLFAWLTSGDWGWLTGLFGGGQ